MWKPIVKDRRTITDIRSKIDEITASILHNLPNNPNGLFDGKAGLFLYLSYLGNYKKIDIHNDLVEQLIGECFEAINKEYLKTTSFCTGISGLLWALHHLKSEGCIEADDYFEDITPALIRQAAMCGSHNDFDYLHGASGIVFYLSHIHPYTDKKYIDVYTHQLKNKGIEDDFTIKWRTIQYSENNKPVYNLSLSHGISSIIIILCILRERMPQNKEIGNLIKKAVTYLRSHKKTPLDEDDSLFPSYISDYGTRMDSRLGWCYGDLGNALALLRAGNSLDDRGLIDEAFQIMIYNSYRRDPQKNHILDAGICHGAAGVAHIFNRMYQQTQKEEFKDAALYWLKVTMGMSTFKDGLAGYKAHNGIDQGYTDSIGLLDGVAGIGLVLMAAISDIEPTWDRAFLIS